MKNVEKNDDVKLKSLFGLRPGVVIILFFVLSLLFLFFILCMLPGLCSRVSYVSFTPTPLSKVGVKEDGTYLGNASASFYRTKEGVHNYVFYYEGEEVGNINIKVKGHVFFTLFHKSVQNIQVEYHYSEKVKEKAKESFISSISEYSRVTEYSDSYFFPPLYSQFARDAILLDLEITDTWLYGALSVSSIELYNDYKIGRTLLSQSKIRYSSKELEEVERYMDAVFGSVEYISQPILFENEEINAIKNGSFFSYKEGNIKMGIETPLTYPEIKEREVVTPYPEFSIFSTLVSESEYALFTEEVPFWKKENKNELISLNLVDEYYLEGITLNSSIKTKKPIRNISYYAASAYVEWLSNKDGVNYHIPSEKEWYVASLSCKDKGFTTSLLSIDKDTSSPSFMMGSLWEFTSTPFVPLSRINDLYDKVVELSSSLNPSLDIIVKGGSYLSDPSLITNESVGIMKKSTCSEYCGIRISRYE